MHRNLKEMLKAKEKNTQLPESQAKKTHLLAEARRYLDNAKDTLKPIPILENVIYADVKYVAKAAGIAYLAALKTIDAYLFGIGKIQSLKEKPKSIDGYYKVVSEMSFGNKMYPRLQSVYNSLHLNAYYKEDTNVDNIKGGFRVVKEMIEIIEGSGK